MNRKALITGVVGQDGSYLAELLLKKGYVVTGIKRRTSNGTPYRIASCLSNPNFYLIEGDVTDPFNIYDIVKRYDPDEIYNLAAQSHVQTSFEQPTETFQVNTIGTLNILEAIRRCNKSIRLYQASTSEMFGSNYDVWTTGKYQNEQTRFAPNSPYATSKLAAHNLVLNYRNGYGLHASCGILFNHESPRRGENFVTRKITKYVARLRNYLAQPYGTMDPLPKLQLGNLDACRDWGYAKDYVYGMWLMLQQKVPDDYVLATGETHTVKDFAREAFGVIGLNYSDHIEVSTNFERPVEVPFLRGEASKAKRKLQWEAAMKFQDLVRFMVNHEIEELDG